MSSTQVGFFSLSLFLADINFISNTWVNFQFYANASVEHISLELTEMCQKFTFTLTCMHMYSEREHMCVCVWVRVHAAPEHQSSGCVYYWMPSIMVLSKVYQNINHINQAAEQPKIKTNVLLMALSHSVYQRNKKSPSVRCQERYMYPISRIGLMILNPRVCVHLCVFISPTLSPNIWMMWCSHCYPEYIFE